MCMILWLYNAYTSLYNYLDGALYMKFIIIIIITDKMYLLA